MPRSINSGQTTGFRPGKAEGLIFVTSSDGGSDGGDGSSMDTDNDSDMDMDNNRDTDNNTDRDSNRDSTGPRNNRCGAAGGIPYGLLCLEKK